MKRAIKIIYCNRFYCPTTRKGRITVSVLLASFTILLFFSIFFFRNQQQRYFNTQAQTASLTIGQNLQVDTLQPPTYVDVYAHTIANDNSGHVYYFWQEGLFGANNSGDSSNALMFRRSFDNVKTFDGLPARIPATSPRDLVPNGYGGNYGELQMCNDQNGRVYLLWTLATELTQGRYLYFNRSVDYGATWQPTDTRIDHAPLNINEGSLYPQLSCDNSGHVYVSWMGYRSDSSHVFFNYSSDYGATWQAQDTQVDRATAGKRHGGPYMTGDNNGHVYVLWEDGRFDDGVSKETRNALFFNYSSDYGATWQAQDIRVDRVPSITARTSSVKEVLASLLPRMSSLIPQVYAQSPVITVQSPNGGETWQTGTTQTIQWNIGDFSQYDPAHNVIGLATRDPSGVTRNVLEIAQNTSMVAGINQLQWTIPTTLTERTDYTILVQISQLGNYDYSDQNFTIYQTTPPSTPTPTISSPTNTPTPTPIPTSPQYVIETPSIATDEQGHVYVAWNDSRSGKIEAYFNRSSDYGATWDAQDRRIDHMPEGIHGEQIQLFAGNDGHVYISFNYGIAPQTNVSKLFFNYSSDYGTTWQPQDVRIDNAPSNYHAHRAKFSGNKNSYVYLVWLQEPFCSSTCFNGQDVYFSYSSDGGQAWQAGTRIDSGPDNTNQGGTTVIRSDNSNHAYVGWEDNRNYSQLGDPLINYYTVGLSVDLLAPTATPTLTPTPTAIPTAIPTPTPIPGPLTINNVQAANITASQATITWTTSGPGTSQVRYGIKSNSLNLISLLDSTFITNHSVTLTALKSNTTYYYRVYSKNSVGTESSSITQLFKTLRASTSTR